MSAATATTPALSLDSPPPEWLQRLLYDAAEQLAGQWRPQASAVQFKPLAGVCKEGSYRASLVCEPATAEFRLYVHHKATGRFVCRSLPVVMDTIDREVWNTDFQEGERP